MSYIEPFDGRTWFLSDRNYRALFLHTVCGTPVWDDHRTDPRTCTNCGVDVRGEAWTRLFADDPVTIGEPAYITDDSDDDTPIYEYPLEG